MEHHLSNIWIGTGELIPLLANLITHLLFLFISLCLPASPDFHILLVVSTKRNFISLKFIFFVFLFHSF